MREGALRDLDLLLRKIDAHPAASAVEEPVAERAVAATQIDDRIVRRELEPAGDGLHDQRDLVLADGDAANRPRRLRPEIAGRRISRVIVVDAANLLGHGAALPPADEEP